jgi:hypothetical protein
MTLTNTIDRIETELDDELRNEELEQVLGGSGIIWTYTKQKSDGTSAGNVAAKWN